MKNIFILLLVLLSGLMEAFGQSSNTSCPTDTLLTHPIAGKENYHVSQLLTSNSQLEDDANVIFLSGKKIRLKPSFKALKGSRFRAAIDDCEPEPTDCINSLNNGDRISQVENKTGSAINVSAIELGYMPNELVVKCNTTIVSTEIEQLKKILKVENVISYPNLELEVWTLASNQPLSITNICETYREYPSILTIEPNYIYQATQSSDTSRLFDPDFHKQWGLHNDGQGGGLVDADIDAPEAWSNCPQTEKIKVAIIDAGIDFTHPDLIDNIWRNLGEDADGDGTVLVKINGCWRFDPDDRDGIDNDGNGYVDDFVGWDFINNDNNPFDSNGHGTHVAGIIGAIRDNGIGIRGVTNNVALVPLKFLDDSEQPIGTLEHAILAIDYCIKNDIPLSNNSWSGERSYLLDSIIAEAAKVNHLFVAGAGNEGNNLERNSGSSTLFSASNTIVVAATNKQDSLWPASNFGVHAVDVAAPGVDIYSTLPNNTYGYKTGTSMAAPFVTGACAYYWGHDASKTYQQVKETLLNTVDDKAQLLGKVSNSGRLNMGNSCLSFCLYKDSLTLVSIYNSFKELDLNLGWDLGQPVSTWEGVKLSASGCNVIELLLMNKGLSGSIPLKMAKLDSLIVLNLAHNNFSGPLPVTFAALSKLKNLELSYNDLYGCFPIEYKKFCEDSSIGAYFIDNIHLDKFDNFCQGMGYVCAEYLPGDSNHDGHVTNVDLLYWGLAYGQQGAKRTGRASDYCTPQLEGLDWDAFIEKHAPVNLKYSDANGDGKVANEDFSILEEAYTGNCTIENNDIREEASNFDRTSKQVKAISVLEGEPNTTRIELYLRDDDGKPISTHGFASKMLLSGIKTATVKIDTSNSCLQPKQYLFKFDPITETLDIALTRTDSIDVECSGAVAAIVIADFVAITGEIELKTINNSTKITFDEQVETIKANDLYIPIATTAEAQATSENIRYWTTTRHHYCDLKAAIEVHSISGISAVTCVAIEGDSRREIPVSFIDSIYSAKELLTGSYEITLKSTGDIVKKDTFQLKDYCLENNNLITNNAQFRSDNLNSKATRLETTMEIGLHVFPNPMQNTATVLYDLPIASPISLDIFDTQGKVQKVLHNSTYQQAGRHQITFQASTLEKGLYLLKLRTNQQIITKKILLW